MDCIRFVFFRLYAYNSRMHLFIVNPVVVSVRAYHLFVRNNVGRPTIEYKSINKNKSSDQMR